MKTLVLIICLATSALGCGATSYVRGRVTVNGWPVYQARVSLVSIAGGSIEGSSITSPFGFYRILAGPCPNNYRLIVRTKWPATFEQPTVFVDGSGEDKIVDINGSLSSTIDRLTFTYPLIQFLPENLSRSLPMKYKSTKTPFR